MAVSGLRQKTITPSNHANNADTTVMSLSTHLIKSDASVRTDSLAHELETTPLHSVETTVRLSAQRSSTLPVPPGAASQCVSSTLRDSICTLL